MGQRGGNNLRIFDMDGPIYRVGTEIADVMILSLYWIVFSIPIITIGASTSAVFYVYGKKVRGEDCYLSKDFWKSFKENFKPSIPITLILILLWISSSLYVFILRGYGTGAPVYLSGIALFFVIEVTVITVYVLGVLSRFYMKTSALFLTAFVLAHKHLLTSVMIIAFIIGINFAALVMPILLIFIPVLIVAMSSFFLQKVFTKHIEAMEEINKTLKENDEVDEEDNEAEDDNEVEEDNEGSRTEIEDEKEPKLEIEGNKDEDKDFLKYI